MRNSSLWSNIVFEKEVFFHKFDSDTSELDWGLEIKHLESTQLRVTRVFILSILSGNFDDQLSWNFLRFVILCICWDTQSKKTGLWQLPIVSRVFNMTTTHILNAKKQQQHLLQRAQLAVRNYFVILCKSCSCTKTPIVICKWWELIIYKRRKINQ